MKKSNLRKRAKLPSGFKRPDIVKVISTYIDLVKVGANYQGLCPFHKEKTESMELAKGVAL